MLQPQSELSCNSKHSSLIQGESKFVFTAEDTISNGNISQTFEQTVCSGSSIVSNVWATERNITCFDSEGVEMKCQEFCLEEKSIILGVPTVRPAFSDLEDCIQNPHRAECKSIKSFSTILNPPCTPSTSSGRIEVIGKFTATCCESDNVLPWKNRKCSLPLHSITMPPTHVHVDTLDSCDPSLSVSWKEPLVDYICPVDITHYKVSCNSANDAVTKMVSDSVLSTELPVIAGEKYLCSVESISHIGKSRKIYGRPVTYRYPEKCLPSSPSNVTTEFAGSFAQDSRKVLWSAAGSPDSPILNYKVSCQSDSLESSTLVPGDSLQAIVTGLELNSTYTCTVTAITAAGPGPISDPSDPFVTPSLVTINKYPTGPANASYEVWLVDRKKPDVWTSISEYEGKANVLITGVKDEDVDTTSSFFNNQGRQYRFDRSIKTGDTIVQAASLYIPSTWSQVNLSDSSTWKTATFWSSIYAPPDESGQGPFSVFGFKNAPFKALANANDQDASSDYVQFVAWDPTQGYWAIDPNDFPVKFDQWNDLVVKLAVKGDLSSRTVSYQYFVNGDLAVEFPDIPLDNSLTDLVFLVNTVNACSGFANYNDAICDKNAPGNSCCTGSTYDTYRTIDAYFVEQ
ncbi:hypothetical protein M9434_003611 [Picochlorum sp. BPE23]|nr:hypothetical protein M9434_003611 [Picochlorum sp. BPE23]